MARSSATLKLSKFVYINLHGEHGGWFHNRPECVLAFRLRGYTDTVYESMNVSVARNAFEGKWLCEGCEKRLVWRLNNKGESHE